jgi:hypothetical protein
MCDNQPAKEDASATETSRRQEPETPSHTMNLPQFIEKFGTNERRAHLVECFLDDLKGLKEYYGNLQIFVFGSFVTAKEEPTDIDVLTRGTAKKHFETYKTKHAGKIQILPSASLTGGGRYTRADVVRIFNEFDANLKNGIVITVDQVIEVTLENLES